MEAQELSRFPPILQLVGLGLLASYVALSVAGRLSRRLQWLWDDPDEAATLDHFVKYTLIPALLLVAVAAAIFVSWDPGAPLGGGWTLREFAVGPGSLALGAALIALAQGAGRRIDTYDASSARSWIPLVLMLAGIGSLAFGAVTLGRTVK
jgi:hypothetical protein